MSKKIIVLSIVTVMLVGAGSFYGGMKYAEGKNAEVSAFGGSNSSPAERQQRSQFGAAIGGFRGGTGGMGARGGIVAGEIISKDDKSVTVKLNNGGSKLIFVSDATNVSKSAEGALSDLQIGTQILANGAPNQDGSINAKIIQLSPQLQR